MKKYFIIFFITILIIPFIALASWWNPFSWFNNDEDLNLVNSQPTTTKEETDTSVKSQTEQIIQEKIIEKTITVDNPELQKQIDALLQENIALQSKVTYLTASLNSCKASNTESVNNNTGSTGTSYSDFDFKYTYENNTFTLITSTYRQIILKKAVFYSVDYRLKDINVTTAIYKLEIGDSSSCSSISPLSLPHIICSDNVIDLERQGDEFVYSGAGIPLGEKIHIKVAANNSAHELTMLPDFSKWVIWDNTTNKPVLIK